MKKVEKLELSDDIYETLLDEYGKLAVVQVEDDCYVVRYPNKVEFDAIKKAQLGSTLQKTLALVENTVEGMIVWPEDSVIKERMEQDGGLLTLVTSQFLGFYMGRAVMDEKKKISDLLDKSQEDWGITAHCLRSFYDDTIKKEPLSEEGQVGFLILAKTIFGLNDFIYGKKE